MPTGRDAYTRKISIILHAVIKVTLEHEYPDIPIAEHDELFVSIIDRIASMRGYGIRRMAMTEGDDE